MDFLKVFGLATFEINMLMRKVNKGTMAIFSGPKVQSSTLTKNKQTSSAPFFVFKTR